MADKWIIIYEGTEVGVLVDCQNIEMFWDSYLVVPNSIENEKILRDKQLWENCSFSFYHSTSKKYAKHALCGGDYLNFCASEQDRISMRGLYLK